MAALHFNYNSNRDVQTNEDGSTQIRVHYPKFKNGEATIRDVRVQQNFGNFISTAYYSFVVGYHYKMIDRIIKIEYNIVKLSLVYFMIPTFLT